MVIGRRGWGGGGLVGGRDDRCCTFHFSIKENWSGLAKQSYKAQ